MIGAHFYCLPCTYRARAAERTSGPANHKLEGGGGEGKKKNLRRERTQGWENRGNSLLKKFIFQKKKKKKFHHSAICISDPRAPRRKSKKANVHCNASEGTLLSSAYLRNRKGLWLGTLPLKNRSSQKSAHRIQPHNQPDTKIQRCNYYPLKPNV